MDKRKKKKKGFTLIEVLVVVLIIGILATIAFPSYTKAVEKSRAREAVQVLSTISLGEQREKLARYKYTNEVDKLDLAYTNFSDGSKATGSTFDGEFFDYKVFGEDRQAAFAQRNNNEYTLSVDYLTKEIFCRPSSHFVCQELGVLEGPTMSNYDTSNIQNWSAVDFVGYLQEMLKDNWSSGCGNDLHCLQDAIKDLCADNGNGTCLNVMNNRITGADGYEYFWGTHDGHLVLNINDYATTPFFAQVFIQNNGYIFLRGNKNHSAEQTAAIAEELGLPPSRYGTKDDWVFYGLYEEML